MLQMGFWHDRGVPRPWTLLGLPPLDHGTLSRLLGDLPVELVVPAERSAQAAQAAAAGAELILGDWTGALGVTAEMVAAAPRLAFVHQPSAGVDSVDVQACTAAEVPVANAGSSNSVSVAEWCVGATFSLLRWLGFADREMRAGGWPQFEIAERGGGELAGRRVGIVGMGRIGRECAVRFGALGCDVAHWSRTRRDPADAGGAPWMPLDDLLRRSDVLVVVIALTPQTEGLLGAAELGMLPPGAFLVDAARGGIVDEEALLAALGTGAIAGGALDVYETEPLPLSSPLRTHDRVLLSPHAAGATRQAQGRVVAGMLDNLRRAVSGEPVLDVVNGLPALIRRRG
jgi:D-3-phosphoglycerate dehydrogenase / 2-oxoglutarate reductase